MEGGNGSENQLTTTSTHHEQSLDIVLADLDRDQSDAPEIEITSVQTLQTLENDDQLFPGCQIGDITDTEDDLQALNTYLELMGATNASQVITGKGKPPQEVPQVLLGGMSLSPLNLPAPRNLSPLAPVSFSTHLLHYVSPFSPSILDISNFIYSSLSFSPTFLTELLEPALKNSFELSSPPNHLTTILNTGNDTSLPTLNAAQTVPFAGYPLQQPAYLQVELDPEVENDDASMADTEHESITSGEPSLHHAPVELEETIPENTPTSIVIQSQYTPLLLDERGILIDSIVNLLLPVPQGLGDTITESTITEKTTTTKLPEKVQV